jgi:hypothetical protein
MGRNATDGRGTPPVVGNRSSSEPALHPRALTLQTTRVRLVLKDAPEGLPGTGTTVRHVSDALPVARQIAAALTEDEPVEVVLAILLDSRWRVSGYVEIARGQLNALRLVAADVLRPVLVAGACSYILTHNHPSGDPSPSAADHTFTETLAELSNRIGVRLVDHLIIGHQTYHSIVNGV